MSNAEIFIYPGLLGADFVLSLFDAAAVSVDPGVYRVMTVFLALFVWIMIIRIAIAVIKKAFGFDHGSVRR